MLFLLTGKKSKMEEVLEVLWETKRKEEKLQVEKAGEMMKALAEKGVFGATEKRAERLRTCSDHVLCKATEDFSKIKMKSEVRCKDRFCPHCQRVDSVKTAIELQTILTALRSDGYKALMLTLTVPNCKGNGPALNYTLQKMSKAFNRLRNKIIRDDTIPYEGFYRTVEVTFNAEKKTFHPHYHVVLIFRSSFNEDTTKKLQRLIMKYWRESFESRKRIDQVHLEMLGETMKDVFEVSKYCAKSSDYLDHGLDVFEAFVVGLKGMRMREFGGIMKDMHKLFQANLLEIPEEIRKASEENKEEDWYWIFWLKWNHDEKCDYIEHLKKLDEVEPEIEARKEKMNLKELREFVSEGKKFKAMNLRRERIYAKNEDETKTNSEPKKAKTANEYFGADVENTGFYYQLTFADLLPAPRE